MFFNKESKQEKTKTIKQVKKVTEGKTVGTILFWGILELCEIETHYTIPELYTEKLKLFNLVSWISEREKI